MVVACYRRTSDAGVHSRDPLFPCTIGRHYGDAFGPCQRPGSQDSPYERMPSCCKAANLQRLMWTPLLCLTPSMSTSTVVMGPTSQVKKAGVMRAFSSAPHLAHRNIVVIAMLNVSAAHDSCK